MPTAPIGGGGAGDSSRLFLERETAKTLQSDTFASQVKATVSGLKDQRWELVNTDFRRNLPFYEKYIWSIGERGFRDKNVDWVDQRGGGGGGEQR